MFAGIQMWLRSCILCLQNKEDHHHKAPLLPIVISGPRKITAADCMAPLSVTTLGYRYIVVIGHLFAKYIEFVALPSIEASIIARVFLDN